MPTTRCEWLLPLAARAIADQVEESRARGENPNAAIQAADALAAEFPDLLRDFGELTTVWSRQIDALTALYAAELDRARRSPESARSWATTIELCRTAELPWEEAYAYQRYAEALLLNGTGSRSHSGEALRAGRALARSLGAQPVVAAVEALATAARIPLDDAEASPSSSKQLQAWKLTEREREILAHLIVGRTYGEIAHDLFISEKTVSSHVSSILRKSGARNRIDLARLVREPRDTSVGH
jgi:DNA-binding CsgD family transcriptional regulator